MFHLALRGEQDDWNIADVAVALDVLEHRDSIHLRHHHIAYHEVVLAGEQHLQTLLAVAGMLKAVPVAQFGLDILGNLVVIVNYQDIEVAVGLYFLFGNLLLLLVFFFQYLAWLQMAVAQRDTYFEAGTLDAVGTVVGLNLASVHFYKRLTEVESDTGSFDMETAAVVSLIETFEEAVSLFFLQSDACIFYPDDGILFVFTYDNSNLAAIKGILHGIGEQVGDNLVKVDAVYPNLQFAFIAAEAFVFFELKGDVALLCIEAVERYDAMQEFLERSLLTVEMHLVLVYLSLIKYLVYQKQEALGIAVDGIDILFAFGIC